MGTKSKKVVSFPETEKQSDRAFAQRWGGQEELFQKGYVPVPSLFLQHYARLNPPLTTGEALFVLQLMDFKWDAKHPFPGYKTIAKRMGISDKMARTHARSLGVKKYLRREVRIGRTNRFDLSLLFEALVKAIPKKTKSSKKVEMVER